MSSFKKYQTLFAGFLLCGITVTAQNGLQQYQHVNFSKVHIMDNFWRPKLEKVSTVTIPVCIDQTEVKTPRIRNFEIAAGKRKGKFEGIFYDDSDVFKALEAIAYSLKNHPDAALEKKADDWINLIAAAQLPDGYINTYYTLQFLDKRWTDMSMHEDYNGGHLIEAAVAYFDATGKRKLLDVAIRFADHFDSLFGPGKRDWVTGHQELELALVKLYMNTQQKKYLQLADWLLSERGQKKAVGYTWTDWKDTAYAQDSKPVREQKEITGHAVRAMYMYTGAADVAAHTGDQGYMQAMKTVWEDVVYRNMYITGGVGSSGNNEGFSVDYDLPNENAYCETCASVGMVLWNQRMGRLTGEGKYIDVLEKSLYNGALDGISLAGDKFFYGNVLASNGKQARRDWFGTACCPANIARLIESLGNYVYGYNDNSIWVNLFVGSQTQIRLKNQDVGIQAQTNYPWEGAVGIRVTPQKKERFVLRVRYPGWVSGEAVPGGLYTYKNEKQYSLTLLSINNQPVKYTIEKGYMVIDREWAPNDQVSISFPMDIRRVYSRSEVKANVERVALQRGPLIYCVEGTDNDGKALNIVLPKTAQVVTAKQQVLTENVVSLEADATVLFVMPGGEDVQAVKKKIRAVPYYTWNNRGAGQMLVWLPQRILDIKIN